ncbi:MAG: sigma-54-dependent Fis family transcriptional regulator [Deltaproteobacteria bacterium]|nr:sigma-54-dependent Fis family transcriptional regulator [Deltaproteobacteria bacterium]
MAVARVLVVDDDPSIRKIIADRMRAQGHDVEVAVDGEAALVAIADFEPELMLLDMKMPKKDGFEVLEALRRSESPPQVVMITAHGNIERAVRAIQMGAADFIAKPFEAAQLDHIVSRVLEAAGLRQRLQRLQTQLSDRHTLVRGDSKAMKEALGLAGRAAASNATVLLLGESGSGKEVMARYIHQQSPRADEAFIALNCATLAGDLLESELFGHERWASLPSACRRSYFASSRSGSSSVLAARKPSMPTFESSPQPTATSARQSRTARFGRTSTTASTSFRFGCHRFVRGRRICKRSWSTPSSGTPQSSPARR